MRNWIDYWDKETLSTDKFLLKHMEIFINQSSHILKYDKDDVILDIGCGKGLLAEFLKDRVKHIYCLDTSKRNIDIVRNKYKNCKNVTAIHLSGDYLDFSFLRPVKFTKIFLISVIQYYSSITDVERLIIEAKKISADNAKLLIADIPIETNIIKNVYGLLIGSIKGRIVKESLRYILVSRFGKYYSYRKELGLLRISESDLWKIINKLNLNASIINTQLTLSSNRKHLLVHFD